MTDPENPTDRSSDDAPSFQPNPDLLDRIMAHQLDDPDAAFPFSARLARENGWTREFALAVIDEYRRFIYLICISSEELTPSDEVDQAWHLHLAYTRDYWLTFCEKVTHQPIHHGPTKGGNFEQSRYDGNYHRTLELYEAVFEESPPPEIWPPAIIRFGYSPHAVRVNTSLFSIGPGIDDGGPSLLQKLMSMQFLALSTAVVILVLAFLNANGTLASLWPLVLVAIANILVALPNRPRFVHGRKLHDGDFRTYDPEHIIEIRQPHHKFDVLYTVIKSAPSAEASVELINASVEPALEESDRRGRTQMAQRPRRRRSRRSGGGPGGYGGCGGASGCSGCGGGGGGGGGCGGGG